MRNALTIYIFVCSHTYDHYRPTNQSFIDLTKGLCRKIRWFKNHVRILFGLCKSAFRRRHKGSPCLKRPSHGMKRFGEILFYLGAARMSDSAEPYQLRRDSELRLCGIYAIPYWAIESCLEVDKKVVCFILLFMRLFQDLA